MGKGEQLLGEVDLRAVVLADADDADLVPGLADVAEDRLDALQARLGHDQHEADAHVEDAVHLVVVDLALALDEVEDRRDGPRGAVDLGRDGLGEHARDVVLEAAAGDVGHAGNLDVVVKKASDRLEEALVYGEKGVADRLVGARKLVLRGHLADVEEHAARKGVAVRLETAGREADDDVSGADGLPRDELPA